MRPLQLRIDDDHYAVRLSRFVDAVHSYETPIVCQLHHAGMFSSQDPVSPSGVACYAFGKGQYIQPRIMTIEKIEHARDKFIEAAVRVKAVSYTHLDVYKRQVNTPYPMKIRTISGLEPQKAKPKYTSENTK